MSTSAAHASTSIPGLEEEGLALSLKRADFMYYNWVIALERPVLPFFIYTFTALTILSLFNVWPPARVYALIALLPMLGYIIWLWSSARGLWAAYPDLAKQRSYSFKDKSYLVQVDAKKTPVAYDRITRVLESRQAFYLQRDDGSADILPKRFFKDAEAFAGFLKTKIKADWRGSSFL